MRQSTEAQGKDNYRSRFPLHVKVLLSIKLYEQVFLYKKRSGATPLKKDGDSPRTCISKLFASMLSFSFLKS